MFYRNIIKISEGPSNIFCPAGALASLWVSCAVWHRDTECILGYLWGLDSTLIQRQEDATQLTVSGSLSTSTDQVKRFYRL